ncbi:acyl-CoA dehydrogenase family protein [Pseudenhygromyxa sp. WMMC2535]|uniref:acyl-CoA dehydrogenase family protein n=1 Tax=Pseudenhygromyxa sp. WMMC2535 TaxID=2712867 RepID=UPI0015566E42|nr:acyl-CoA dehydrogenase family protein [Pseudenhygromyxa sp. WMMC2535]NVB42598.1 acyl-CoA dehydrogenase family protein [Pseudenhygromyxa sp. WMMC2535]
MPIRFDIEPQIAALAQKTREFISEVVIPVEIELGGSVHDAPESLRRDLQAQARAAGLLAPHVGEAWGGLGLDTRGQAVIFEEAGYSLLGPLALNISAPDEGNMHLLEHAASEDQKQRYLVPLTAGEIRSCFAMTEPPPGAGSDPRALATTAKRVEGGWRIDGRKWFITGARGAQVAIVMARTSGAPGERGGATMLLVDGQNPGMRVVRDLETLDIGLFAGHSEVVFEDCRVPDDAILGEVDRGFEYAQLRLAPARLTHCMRWLGLARRAQALALAHVTERRGFGSRLAELGMVQQQIADNEIDIAASRALIYQTAWILDSGEGDASLASSMAKTFVAEAVGRITDRCVQIAGAVGTCSDLLLARYWQEVRPFRIYDGPSETHRWSIAKRTVKRFGSGQ